MHQIDTSRHKLINCLAELYAAFPQVEAIAFAGSLTSGAAPDPASDIDLYIYISAPIPPDARVTLVEQAGGASRADMDLDFWGPGDEWFHAGTGIEVDVMYWDTHWIERMLEDVLNHCQASLGYTTSFWHTVRSSRMLFDRSGWFKRLQEWCDRPYPEKLRQAIITRNFAVLRDVIPAYLTQIDKAVRRGDLVSVNHRVAALLASYFDIIYAYNRVLHPGEKRLLEQAVRLCPVLPENMATQVTAVLRAAGQGNQQLVEEVNRLVDGVEGLVKREE